MHKSDGKMQNCIISLMTAVVIMFQLLKANHYFNDITEFFDEGLIGMLVYVALTLCNKAVKRCVTSLPKASLHTLLQWLKLGKV